MSSRQHIQLCPIISNNSGWCFYPRFVTTLSHPHRVCWEQGKQSLMQRWCSTMPPLAQRADEITGIWVRKGSVLEMLSVARPIPAQKIPACPFSNAERLGCNAFPSDADLTYSRVADGERLVAPKTGKKLAQAIKMNLDIEFTRLPRRSRRNRKRNQAKKYEHAFRYLEKSNGVLGAASTLEFWN